MKYFIARNKQWLEFVWIGIVLVFFKLYNNFIFEQGESYIFFVALFFVYRSFYGMRIKTDK